MQNKRLELHNKLVDLLGNNNVYFQPPETIKLNYPCIIYERSDIETIYADDRIFSSINEYTVTVIDKNPDSGIPNKILTLPLCSFDRHFTSENLNHDVFIIYY